MLHNLRMKKIYKLKNMGIIQVNGKNQLIDNPILLIDLIKNNHVEKPELVTIQINGEFVDREQYGTTMVKTGDEADFLYFMGGGSRC